jgi:hypothetical protein
MYRRYYTHEEREAYKEGRRDESYDRYNYDYDRYSDNAEDRAYWQGREDEKREERMRWEEREYD